MTLLLSIEEQADVVSNSKTVDHTLEYGNLTTTEIPHTTSLITRIHYTFIINGFLLISGSVLHLSFNFVASGCNAKHVHLQKKVQIQSRKGIQKRKQFSNNRLFKITIICLVGLASFVWGGHSTMFGSFLVEYTVTGLNWNNDHATDITSLFWASNLASKVLAALLSKRISVTVLLGCSSGLILISNILMLFTADLPPSSLWVSVIGTGLGLGSVTSYLITMGMDVMSSNGMVSSLVLVSMYVGKVATSPVIGFVFQNVGYTWFLYISLIFSSVMFIDYIFCIIIMNCQKKAQRKSFKESSFTNCSLQATSNHYVQQNTNELEM